MCVFEENHWQNQTVNCSSHVVIKRSKIALPDGFVNSWELSQEVIVVQELVRIAFFEFFLILNSLPGINFSLTLIFL